MIYRWMAVVILLVSFLQSIASETLLRDPRIPDGETAVYRVTEGDSESWLTDSVALLMDQEREVYGITSRSDRETTEVKIGKLEMLPYYVRTVTKGTKMAVVSSTEISLFEELHTEAIAVLSLTDLKFVLRGFPFGEGTADIGVEFLSANEDSNDSSFDFEIRVRYHGTEEFTIGERTIDSHKLELKMKASGIMRLLNGLIPRTFFWYSVEKPHYLVAYEGSGGFGSSQKVHMEIAEYTGWDR